MNEGTLARKKSGPIHPAPRSNGHRRNSPGNLGKLLLFQHSCCPILGMTDHSFKQAGQDKAFGERDVLLFPGVRAVVAPEDWRIVAVHQREPIVTALVLAVEVEMVALDGELPGLVTWAV